MIAEGKMFLRYLWGSLNAERLKASSSMLVVKKTSIQQINMAALRIQGSRTVQGCHFSHSGGLNMRPSAAR